MVHRIAIVFVAVASLATCDRCSEGDARGGGGAPAKSSSSAPSRIGSCDRVAATSVCSEYAGAYLAQNEASLTSTCSKLGGAFAYAECPNTSVLGSCRLATTEVRKFYGSGGAAWDLPRAKTECETAYGGTWAPYP